jgi:phosphoribosylpyrophosphate synthetase
MYPVGSYINFNIGIINSMSDCLVSILKTKFAKNDNILLFCRGSSGSILSGIISVSLIKEGFNPIICHIKKSGESAHSDNDFDDVRIGKATGIIVDDFICTGETIRHIMVIYTRNLRRKVDVLCVSGFIPEGIAHEVSLNCKYVLSTDRE